MNNETPYKVGTSKDMEVGALNPKVKKLMEEAENKSDQLDIQIVLLSRVCDVKENTLDELVTQGEARKEEHKKWCRLQKRRDRIQMVIMTFAFSILFADLYNNEGSIVHNTIRVIKAMI